MTKLLQLFKELVAIDSPSGEEEGMSDFIMKYLTNLGLTPRRDKNLMIYCKVGKNQSQAIFCAHLDTVEPGRDIQVIENSEYLSSAGNTILGADNKVSVSAILHSTTKVIEQKIPANFEIIFSVREETNSGISEFDTRLLQAKRAYIFDAGNGDLAKVVTAAPYIIDFAITVTGQPAHASSPEKGNNALITATSILTQISLGRADANSTLNVGLISGGSATNTVPGIVEFSGDLRSTDNDSFNKIKQQIINICKRLEDSSGCIIKIKWTPYSLGYTLNTDTLEYRELSKVYEELGYKLKQIKTTSGSDAGFFNSLGITGFCLGDGVENAHGYNERISIKTFLELEKIVFQLMINSK